MKLALSVLLLAAACAAVSAKEPAKAELLVVKVVSVTPEGVVAMRNRTEQVKKIMGDDSTVQEATKKILAMSTKGQRTQYQKILKNEMAQNPNKAGAVNAALNAYRRKLEIIDKESDGKTVFITMPDTSHLVDDDDLVIRCQRDGSHRYMSAGGAACTVPKYAALE